VNWKVVAQSMHFETWMIGVRLDCLKSSGQLATSPSSEKRLRPRLNRPIERVKQWEFLRFGTAINEIDKTTKGHPTSSSTRHLRLYCGIAYGTRVLR
jgi:hypothetical protein